MVLTGIMNIFYDLMKKQLPGTFHQFSLFIIIPTMKL